MLQSYVQTVEQNKRLTDENESFKKALESVEAWWVETGLEESKQEGKFGAPNCIFQVRAVLEDTKEKPKGDIFHHPV
jgi:hypothetical protein